MTIKNNKNLHMKEFEDIDFSDILEDGFSIVTEEIDERKMPPTDKNQKVFPILPVRNMVMFPKVVIPITAGRQISKSLLESAQENNELIGIISQKIVKQKTQQKKIFIRLVQLLKL